MLYWHAGLKINGNDLRKIELNKMILVRNKIKLWTKKMTILLLTSWRWAMRTAMRSTAWVIIMATYFIFVPFVWARRPWTTCDRIINPNMTIINTQIGWWFNGSNRTFHRIEVNKTVSTRTSCLQCKKKSYFAWQYHKKW